MLTFVLKKKIKKQKLKIATATKNKRLEEEGQILNVKKISFLKETKVSFFIIKFLYILLLSINKS